MQLLTLLFTLIPLFATQEPAAPARSLTAEGLAFGGFDPVSTFPAGGGKAVAGDERFEVRLAGARYRFASAAHKAWFEAEPSRYEPAYGGFDAAAMAQGARKPAVPANFRLQGARLFVFAEPSAAAGMDAALIAAADAAWKRASGEPPRGLVLDDARVGAKWNLGKGGLAIEGYDPVAYFPEGGGKAALGDPKFETVQGGAKYRFTSEAHRTWFLAEPARYQPKYGGWCAYAMVEGDDVEIDPQSFLVQDGRLFLFYKGLFADTRAKWLPKSKEFLPKADAEWAKRKPGN
jgi:YHS domain-containing protein